MASLHRNTSFIICLVLFSSLTAAPSSALGRRDDGESDNPGVVGSGDHSTTLPHIPQEQTMKIDPGWSGSNRLAGSGSPYLEQHAGNPVNWQPWGEKAFEEARRRNLPVLVSIGYSSCHWCHVMAHESFENSDVAAVMNDSQINVKVDREQHPAVDALYMEASIALNGSGGWPLNVFVDHEGRPFLAITYLPPDRWTALINEVNRIWRESPERINEVAGALVERTSESGKSTEGKPDPAEFPGILMDYSRRYYTPENPGFTPGMRGMKFPPSQNIDWLLEYGGDEGKEMAVNILTAMMDSGLHDRVGGGFHRYTTDEIWRVPHFEKMTYDNAQLMGLYARGSSIISPGPLSADLLSAARSIADWFLDEMREETRDGVFLGYATSIDADDPLGEGAFYAWPLSALEKVLGTDDALWLAERWNISGSGLLPETVGHERYEPVSGWIPHPRGAAGYPENYRRADPRDSEREAALITKLRRGRGNRPAPERDDKVLTDQNALILEGFSRLYRYGGGEKYRQAAVELAGVLLERASGDRLFRAPGIEAYITDYGYLAMALTQVYSITGNPAYVDSAEKTAGEAINRLGAGNGAYYTTPEGEGGLYKRSFEDYDGPSPAGQYALGIAFARLYGITGKSEWKERADRLLETTANPARINVFSSTSLVRLASLRSSPYTFVVAGPAAQEITGELLETTRRLTGPDMMVVAAEQAAAGGGKDWTELAGRIGLEQPQLLVCREGSCLLPAFTLEEAEDQLGNTRILYE